MKFFEIVEKVIETKTITADIETEIDKLLWSEKFDAKDMAALARFIEVLSDGTVESNN